ncbi:hypothetical protein BWK69_00645 [Candidatus Parcubacteria bacterium A4]|nr:MAG: hypothetical protein BWK69_00645 [Candidatus Parcubacteria bacterium A4]
MPYIFLFFLFILFVCSMINIPLGKKKLIYFEKKSFFGLFKTPMARVEGVFINLGGAIIPLIFSFYLLFLIWKKGFDLEPVLLSVFLLILVCKFLSRVVPGKGIVISPFIPPIFSALLALFLAPEYAASCAFISGVWGTLIGGDLLNLGKIKKVSPGMISIGGAGVFDGIFLVGVISFLLTLLVGF